MRNNIHLDKNGLLSLLGDARELVAFYDVANRANPKNHHNYGTVDTVALNMLEKQTGRFVIGVKLHGEDVRVHMQEGAIMPDGTAIAVGDTHDYLLQGFQNSTTVNRFARTVCDVVDSRAIHPEVKTVMIGNARAYASRVKQELGKYT